MRYEEVQSVVCDYLARKSAERAELRAALAKILETIPDTVIFGGMLRDFAWGTADSFSSDIDLVTNSSREKVYQAISCFSPSINKFGGFRFVSGGQHFDIWALQDTWAFREGFVEATGFDALLQTTFFGVDAAMFHLQTKKYMYSSAHDRGISNRMLELNLAENPNPRSMVRRAVSMALKWNLSISADLGRYMIDHWDGKDAHIEEKLFLDDLRNHLFKTNNEAFRFSGS